MKLFHVFWCTDTIAAVLCYCCTFTCMVQPLVVFHSFYAMISQVREINQEERSPTREKKKKSFLEGLVFGGAGGPYCRQWSIGSGTSAGKRELGVAAHPNPTLLELCAVCKRRVHLGSGMLSGVRLFFMQLWLCGLLKAPRGGPLSPGNAHSRPHLHSGVARTGVNFWRLPPGHGETTWQRHTH